MRRLDADNVVTMLNAAMLNAVVRRLEAHGGGSSNKASRSRDNRVLCRDEAKARLCAEVESLV